LLTVPSRKTLTVYPHRNTVFLANPYLSMLGRMGVQADHFGDSTSQLSVVTGLRDGRHSTPMPVKTR
jgi:hypothetical protein